MKPFPNSDLAREVIRSIVSLTEQRDQRSLELSLVRTLEEMLEEMEDWLLDIPKESSREFEFNLLHGDKPRLTPNLVEHGHSLPFDKRIHRVSQGGQVYLMAKLQGAERDRYHLLILAKRQWNETELQLVHGLLRVYRNFVGVLFDSEKDTLTGLYNRRKLESKLKDIDHSRKRGRRRADKDHADFIAMLDLDHFKRVNDKFGHLVGDEVLLVFADILRKTLRDRDLIFRYGGEEFVVLLQDLSASAVREVLERLLRNVELHEFPQAGKITTSIGYAAIDPKAPSIRALEKADKSVYYAKDNGRNQVCDFDDLPASKRVQPPLER